MHTSKQNARWQAGGKANSFRANDYRATSFSSQTPAEKLLSLLDKVRPIGRDRWLACCPAHNDKSPSLSIREADDGRLLIHCFGGCDVYSIVSAVGLELHDLFPPRSSGEHYVKGERRPFPASDVLRAIAHEALIIVFAGSAIADGTLTELGRCRSLLAASRIQAALDAAGLSA
jgi:DNA primase (bacterial type)